jgi:hypothetical protein
MPRNFFFFETGSPYIADVDFELAMLPSLALNSLIFLGAGIIGVCCHAHS